MKIKKSELRKIIKEELSAMIAEAPTPALSVAGPALAGMDLKKIINQNRVPVPEEHVDYAKEIITDILKEYVQDADLSVKRKLARSAGVKLTRAMRALKTAREGLNDPMYYFRKQGVSGMLQKEQRRKALSKGLARALETIIVARKRLYVASKGRNDEDVNQQYVWALRALQPLPVRLSTMFHTGAK